VGHEPGSKEENIADSDMDICNSKKIISGLLKPMTADLKSRYISLKDGQVMSEISKAKAQEESPDKLRARATALGSKGEILSIIAEVSCLLYA